MHRLKCIKQFHMKHEHQEHEIKTQVLHKNNTRLRHKSDTRTQEPSPSPLPPPPSPPLLPGHRLRPNLAEGRRHRDHLHQAAERERKRWGGRRRRVAGLPKEENERDREETRHIERADLISLCERTLSLDTSWWGP